MRRRLKDQGLSCDNRAINVAFTPQHSESQKLCGRKIQALGVKFLRLRLGPQAVADV